jgi:hypothetical protein
MLFGVPEPPDPLEVPDAYDPDPDDYGGNPSDPVSLGTILLVAKVAVLIRDAGGCIPNWF